MNFKARYDEYLHVFNDYLTEWCNHLTTRPNLLGESMTYSLSCGGKRIRPVLMLAVSDLLGVERSRVLPFALALEMIHTYSLIHDDLPAMDGDDYRRGQPSNHKVFGEGNAVLAGDALLNTAYSICFQQWVKDPACVRAGELLCESAGIFGMIAGQSADLSFTGKQADMTEEDLLYIYEHKTGKLLSAPILISSILSGDKYYLELEKFGRYLGLLFQITDDILDVEGKFSKLGKTVGKDEREEKFTSVRLYGLNGAKIRADIYAQEACVILDGLDVDTSFLSDLIEYIRNREN